MLDGAAPAGGAVVPFATGTSVTLRVQSGRDAIWSGACSSGGQKAKTCTLTVSSAATVSVNVV